MYQPSQFVETRMEAMHALIEAHPLGTLVTLGADGLNANHLPFEVEGDVLRCHVARANPVWHDHDAASEVLVVFQGPQAYVSPSWYPSKQENHRAVPTYNYMVVHAYGRMRIIEDKQWLLDLVTRLSDRNERGRAQPWSVSDAPADYIDKMLGAIVGIEIPVARLIGKWKVSQNHAIANREGVMRGLREDDGEQRLAMAEEIARFQ